MRLPRSTSATSQMSTLHGVPGPGSSVSLTLYFLRYALGVNLVLCLLWIACAVVPFLLSPPPTFAWAYFTLYPPLSLLQGYGLHNTFLLYGAGVLHPSMHAPCFCMHARLQACCFVCMRRDLHACTAAPMLHACAGVKGHLCM